MVALDAINLAPQPRWIVTAIVIGALAAIVVTLAVAAGFLGVAALVRRPFQLKADPHADETA